MKKRLLRSIVLILSTSFMLSGCAGADLLNEIPKDLTLDVFQVKENDDETVEKHILDREAELPFISKDAYEFSRQNLSEAERLWYDDIKYVLGSFKDSITLSGEALDAGLSESDIGDIFQYVLNDHPELFFVEGYSYTKYTKGDEISHIGFEGTYNVDYDTAVKRKDEMEAVVDAVLSTIDPNAGEYEKVKFVYEYVINSTEYDLNSADNQNMYSVFLNHYSVCQGYAKATQYLLNRLGMECSICLGYVYGGEGHAWNLVKIDGEYYYVDTTWGDASYKMDSSMLEADTSRPAINYDYLNVTTEEIQRTHVLVSKIEMPVADSIAANYYYRMGEVLDGYDENTITDLFRKAVAEGRNEVTIKCLNEDTYNQICNKLINEQKILDFVKGMGNKVAYSQNVTLYVVTFWMTN